MQEDRDGFISDRWTPRNGVYRSYPHALPKSEDISVFITPNEPIQNWKSKKEFVAKLKAYSCLLNVLISIILNDIRRLILKMETGTQTVMLKRP